MGGLVVVVVGVKGIRVSSPFTPGRSQYDEKVTYSEIGVIAINPNSPECIISPSILSCPHFSGRCASALGFH